MKTTARAAVALLSSATALMLATPARAQLTTYEDEAAYVAALAALGASVFQEGFENGAAWGSARFPTTALSVTSQGVVWAANAPSSRITTSGGAAQTGDWGVFALPHGITTGGEFDVQRDGFIGTRAGSALFGVGGWVSTSTPGAEVQFAIDGAAVGFADPLLMGPARFFGVIDAAGFTTFEVYEVQGRVGDQKFIFADDFTLGAAGTGPNNPPTAIADAVTAAEDTPVSVDVLANDGDPDLDPLTVLSVGAPGHGTAVLEADRTVTYAPGPDFHGTDGFLYVIRDPGGLTASATVTVTVAPVNDPPAASPDSAATPESTPVTIAVLANDQDVDGDALQVTAVGTPGHGTAVLEADRTITYTPAPGFNGTDGFGYTVSDGALTASATVTVAVSAVNQPPVAAADAGGCGCSGGGASGLALLPLLALRRRRRWSHGAETTRPREREERSPRTPLGIDSRGSISTSAADDGNAFRYDAIAGQYVFNLATRALATGTYLARIDMGDGVERSVTFSLKP